MGKIKVRQDYKIYRINKMSSEAIVENYHKDAVSAMRALMLSIGLPATAGEGGGCWPVRLFG